ncbi:hypothetical protein CON15_23115 [Bacillus cereus]|nr:hypothetical protein CON15_23115 [Bacillus cereus]PET98224.1 hypothetical protein CN531_30695 [Bacillus cereus]PEW62961.1 hypothetical protein CN443_09665 [Bacillus cereus]PEX34191.1 hypothetical protein CN459_07220 [Bacillus cereus]PEY21296.1 hypothetical protein CN331_09960 [Bacillus cereus]
MYFFFEYWNVIDAKISNIIFSPEERWKSRLKALLNRIENLKLNNKFSGNKYINAISETQVWNDLKDKYNGKLNIIKVNE